MGNASNGSFTFRMNVVSLCLLSSWKTCPQALQLEERIPRLEFTLMTVSGLSHLEQRTNLGRD